MHVRRGSSACGPTDAHEPTTTDEHRCGVGVQVQPAVDAARAIIHDFGLRPYRVFLVHEERDATDRVWRVVREREITPVEALGLHEVQLNVTPAGVLPVGGVRLRQISPQAFTEDDLRGWLDGKPWASAEHDRQWYYEIRIHERCAGDPDSRRRRFMIEGEPELRPMSFEWRVRLTAAMHARDRDGRDATVAYDEIIPGVQRPKAIP
jgi:hypothetical protein